ncbi:uncharacterized protein LOC121862086 isoform X2 [Homarus americanus]|uniref:uncharacterized protein LOC121862086 isoform X2 n=1 Tax=Homarus americanus TaxID=6706 RepID=UPI001C47EEB2|nr:uncharacterized protein LOC121862086 isoform X2 [Homarus americanus]
MRTMKTVGSVILLLGLLQGAVAFLCYDTDSWVTFCPSGSCFSVGGNILGLGDTKKGCAEKSYPLGCQSLGLPGIASEHTCFCNSFLCNSSSMPSILMPLLLLPYLIQKLL